MKFKVEMRQRNVRFLTKIYEGEDEDNVSLCGELALSWPAWKAFSHALTSLNEEGGPHSVRFDTVWGGEAVV